MHTQRRSPYPSAGQADTIFSSAASEEPECAVATVLWRAWIRHARKARASTAGRQRTEVQEDPVDKLSNEQREPWPLCAMTSRNLRGAALEDSKISAAHTTYLVADTGPVPNRELNYVILPGAQ